jgi:hypothetical protein
LEAVSAFVVKMLLVSPDIPRTQGDYRGKRLTGRDMKPNGDTDAFSGFQLT